MENKDFPEMASPEPESVPAEAIAEYADAASAPTPPAQEPAEQGFVDYFADILPDQPVPAEVTEEMASAEDTAPQQEPVSDPQPEPAFVSADTAVLTEIQSAVESIMSESETNEAPLSAFLPEEAPAETAPAPQEEVQADDSAEETAPPAEKPEEEPAPPKPRPVRKGRPKRKKGEFLFGLPQIAVTCVWLAIILVTGITLGRMLWVCAADVLAFGREDKLVTITVYESDTIEDITEKLHRAGLIRYPGLFGLYADLAVDEGEIQPGIWDLNTMYDYHALVNMMSPSSSREVVENVLIPEGYTCRQIFELLEANRVCTAKDLAEYAANGELKSYWFLEGHERGFEYCLEGFLFPDTYDFYKNSSPRDVLEKMLDNFDYRFTEEMQLQMADLNANVTGNTFDIHEVVIVASMIEKETANHEESPVIASVIYNRLFNWGATPAYLNIDASIVYALDGKTDLTTEDLKVESPYNTYTNVGLTPGAISNPGLASLKAALNPSTTNYYFYVLNPAQGAHKFSTTLEEHNAFIATLE